MTAALLIYAAQKTCRCCGETKLMADFDIKRSSADGRNSRCKACRAAARRGNKPPAEKVEITEEFLRTHMRTCSRCGESKPLTDYHKKEGGKYGRKTICATCCSHDSAAYRIAHPDYFRDWRNNNREYVRNLNRAARELKKQEQEAQERINNERK